MAIILSQCVPTTSQTCGSLTIQKHKRFEVGMPGGSNMHLDSLLITSDLSENEQRQELREWLPFHSFILNDSTGLSAYHSIRESDFRLQGEPVYEVDFNDLRDRVYFLASGAERGNHPIKYEELFARYKALSDKERGAIKGFLVNLGQNFIQNSPLIADTSYWQIMVYYAVIEYVVGRQPACTFHPKCPEATCYFHDSSIPPHNQKTYDEHLKSYLLAHIADKKIVDEYMDVLRLVYKEIRNDVAHRAVTPSATMIAQAPSTTVSYDFARISSSHRSDAAALYSLLTMIQDIARHLLLDKLFGLAIFPKLAALQTTRIVAGNPKS